MNDVESVVAAGAEWFDQTEGDRWVWLVDLDRLDMTQYTLCVFGQVEGKEISAEHFSDGSNDEWNQSHGFEEGSGVSSRDLQDAWTDLIRKRRESRTV